MAQSLYKDISAAAPDPAQVLNEDEEKLPKIQLGRKMGRNLGKGNSKRDALSTDDWGVPQVPPAEKSQMSFF